MSQLIDDLKRFRPRDTILEFGIGITDKEEYKDYYEFDAHVLNTFSKEDADKINEFTQYKLTKISSIKCLPLSHIIQKYFPSKPPTILLIDVEGLDYEILKQVPFQAWRPAIVCAETINFPTDSESQTLHEIIYLMSKSGYKVFASTFCNTIFIKTYD